MTILSGGEQAGGGAGRRRWPRRGLVVLAAVLLAVGGLTALVASVVRTSGSSAVDTVTTAVPAGAAPVAVAVNDAADKIYVANIFSDNVTEINGATDATNTVRVGTTPFAIAVNPTTDKIYVANAGSGTVSVINGATNTATTLRVGAHPDAVAVNPATDKIYVANFASGTVSVINGATNATTTVRVGTTPFAIAVNPATDMIYVANRDSDNVTVINGATSSTTAVAAGTNPEAVAVNPATDKIYVANFNSGNVTVINGATNTRPATGSITVQLPRGSFPRAVAVNPATNKIYVANLGANSVTVIDGANNSTVQIGVGSDPQSLAIIPTTNTICVTNQESNDVTLIDGVTNNTTTVFSGSLPDAVAADPTTRHFYVANQTSNDVTGINVGAESIRHSTSAANITRSPSDTNRSGTRLTAANGFPWSPGATGYDISWPQCGGPFPPPAEVAIVGATRGYLNVGPNPCYREQVAWAGAGLSSYIVASPLPSPAPPESMSGPYGTCSGNVVCQSGNFGYYWGQHWISYSRSLGINPNVWWLDVEIGKGWNTSPAAHPTNNAVINGALAGMRAMGVTAGIYATSYQWGVITGNQLSYPGIPLWVPGGTTLANDPKSAMAICTGTIPNYVPFAGGDIVLVQYGYINGPPYPFDLNFACVTHTAAYAGPAVASWALGRLDLFARGANNAIWQAFFNVGRWSGWVSQGGTVVSDPAAVSWGPNRVDVFGVGSDGRLWQRFWDGRAWIGWMSPFGAPPPGIAPGSGPAVASWAPGRLDVFVRGTDNAIWQVVWSGGRWSGWVSQGGAVVSDPAAVSWGPNRVDVFGVGSDGRLWQRVWDGRAWSNWVRPFGLPPAGMAPGSGPAASSWAPGQLDVFVRGGDNAIWQIFWNAGWSSWISQGRIIVSNPAAVSQSVNQIDLFGTGADGRIYQKAWNGRAWSAWFTATGRPPPGVAVTNP